MDGPEPGTPRRATLLATVAIALSLALVALDRLFAPGGFAIREVTVSGVAPRVDPAEVLGAVRALGPRSWFSVDLAEVRNAVEQVPWVHDAGVRRKWPRKLVVTVSEAEPAARWNDVAWLSDEGEFLVVPDGYGERVLPRLHGPVGSQRRVLEMHARIAPLVDERFSIARFGRDARGVWSMRLASRAAPAEPLAVTIGRRDAEARVRRLMRVLASGLGPASARLERVDLRYPNGFAARFAKRAASPRFAGTGHGRDRRDG